MEDDAYSEIERNIHIAKASERTDTGSKDTTALNSVGEPRDESKDHSTDGIRRDREELRFSVRCQNKLEKVA